ncbi:MAG TPA: undecaprenyl/decaprenyl-phosphate alpha-N-acetylglucosaminyl 1-phosphate transferase [Candidatus Olsenella pullistercoris]|uniref:Undecaprenyl/decaprenyl-phosphate alpha-N-acetylglucosaminyl 1-phosphate transferase n=1 Tax=Candidatus Olsenella pullistercoris TaxID=2838712 RepID=A0A9D2EYP4_9ACTN|nr:undecaprenyl/decaprenyl-phosphate alpha-N-acetylglucosaminyl 1-phosphate transferase [Candidatus Olsenella pullistercoris]
MECAEGGVVVPNWIPYLCLFLSALAVTLLTTPLARRIAVALGAVDMPNPRRINKVPVPRMGGIAIFLGIVAAFVAQYVGTLCFDWPAVLVPSPKLQVNYWMLVAAFLVIFLTGVIDDARSLLPWQKLIGQIAAATIAAGGGLVIGAISNPFARGVIDLGWLAYPVTVVYLVSYTNIINLIDGLDGLAAGISGIASVTMFALSVLGHRPDAAALSVAVAGASLAFLRYNFHPASIFMGDSGSLTLGFALGTVSLLSVTRFAGLTTIIVPLVIAAVPIIDTFSAIVRRLRGHVSISHADRGHIHHRLMAEGFDQRQSVLLMYAWTALLCVGSVVMTQVSTWPRIAVFCVLLGASMVFARHLHLFEPVLLHHYDPRTGEDELVTPADDAFEEEAEKLHERRRHTEGRQ